MAEPTFDHERHAVYRRLMNDVGSNLCERSDLKRIVSMLTRLLQRTETVAEDQIEYEYREAEYEYEEDQTPDTWRTTQLKAFVKGVPLPSGHQAQEEAVV